MDVQWEIKREKAKEEEQIKRILRYQEELNKIEKQTQDQEGTSE